MDETAALRSRTAARVLGAVDFLADVAAMQASAPKGTSIEVCRRNAVASDTAMSTCAPRSGPPAGG
ncbi:hypothetical protein SCOCK_50253 [Actinacidiphila cocklensis]|uniref:Uncharacterized protein n=1 Tax=Actinacidiphila cocklensis TaxID=887465 RepID=A0A9W4E0F7_9ACTN|nr:hypothetical protein SCOCK_50253 [Actinacidiphila cocklensis]